MPKFVITIEVKARSIDKVREEAAGAADLIHLGGEVEVIDTTVSKRRG